MNTKLHIIGITLIVLLALVGLIVTGKIHFGEPPSADNAQTMFVQVDTASWGMNCIGKGSPATPPSQDSPPPLRKDNVLRRISALCNNQPGCDIKVDPQILGDDPAPACTKQLMVEYRCQQFERVRRVNAEDGHAVTLDCTVPPATPGAGKTPK